MTTRAVPLNDGSRCWWCLFAENVHPMAIYLGDDSTVTAFATGNFCSFQCTYAFLALHDFPEEAIAMLHRTFRKNFPSGEILRRAASPYVLQDPYGGLLTYNEFHKCHHQLQNLPLHGSVHTIAKYIDVKMEKHLKRKRLLETMMAP